ncbi:MAG: thermonuclease family protein [Candidatus Brocadiales bacterium]
MTKVQLSFNMRFNSKRVAAFIRVSAMLTICIRTLICMTLFCATSNNVYAQEEEAPIATPPAPAAEVPTEAPEEEPYLFDADSYIIDRKPEAPYKVIKVISANTILLENGERVRLLGVEVAEGNAEGAYRLMRRLLEGKEVKLEFKRRNRDIHGNLLATVYKGDINMNILLTEEFLQHTEIDPSFSYSPGYLDSVFSERKRAMDFWELTLGEKKPLEKKIAVIKLKAKDKPVVEGELVKESKDYLIIRRLYKGLELVKKRDVEKLTFK